MKEYYGESPTPLPNETGGYFQDVTLCDPIWNNWIGRLLKKRFKVYRWRAVNFTENLLLGLPVIEKDLGIMSRPQGLLTSKSYLSLEDEAKIQAAWGKVHLSDTLMGRLRMWRMLRKLKLQMKRNPPRPIDWTKPFYEN